MGNLKTVVSLRRSLSFLVLVTGMNAYAGFEISPIIVKLGSSGDNATTSISVTNVEDAKTPVQIMISNREPDLDGKEEYKESAEAEDSFRIFPTQFVLNPKETRSVRITWIGEPRLKTEKAFRIIAEELPIDVDDANKNANKAVARIKVSTRYVGSLYVTPTGAAPKLTYEANRITENSKPKLQLKVENKGTAHQILRQPIIKLVSTANNATVELKADQVKEVQNQNILSGRTRRFTLDWPANLPPGPVKVNVETAKE